MTKKSGANFDPAELSWGTTKPLKARKQPLGEKRWEHLPEDFGHPSQPLLFAP